MFSPSATVLVSDRWRVVSAQISCRVSERRAGQLELTAGFEG